MTEYISQHTVLLILTEFEIKHNMPEDVIENILIKFDTTADHRLWTRETIELAKKEIFKNYVIQEHLYP